MHKGVIIFGLCRLTKDALDIFQKNNLMVYGILEDETKWHNTEIHGIPVLGSTDNQTFLELLNEECASFLAYGNLTKRKHYLDFLTSKAKQASISAIHPSAIMANVIQLGQGNYIGAQVCLASEVTVGNHCMLHNSVTIEPQTTIHDLVQIGAGSVIGDHVTIESEVFIGIGARIMPGITIQKGANISAGAVVLENVKCGDILLRNPAKSINTQERSSQEGLLT